jgi:hypothetical protein
MTKSRKGPAYLATHMGSVCTLHLLAPLPASLSRVGFEVYSRSIKARVSYDAPDAEDHTEDGASKDDVTNRFIDPYDSIQMFYTTAMRRIHRGVCTSDPATRSKCVGLYPGAGCRPFGAVRAQMLFTDGRTSSERCLQPWARTSSRVQVGHSLARWCVSRLGFLPLGRHMRRRCDGEREHDVSACALCTRAHTTCARL